MLTPTRIGQHDLTRDELKMDKRGCKRIGPCGFGQKAIYLNSFFIDRRFYVTWEDVSRIYKRVAMSKGGYSGRGIFSSMAYLVVEMKGGSVKQCNFKFEDQVDQFIDMVQKSHPELPIHSEAAEKKLEEARREEEARYIKNLSEEAKESIARLEEAKEYLEKNPEIGRTLTYAAKQKRSVDGIRKSNLLAALCIAGLGAGAIILGIYNIILGNRSWASYAVLFGFAFIFSTAAAGILPTMHHNRRSVQKDWEEAVRLARDYIRKYRVKTVGNGGRKSSQTYSAPGDFPLPAQYAHPVVIDRMIRVIREGKAKDIEGAYQIMSKELKALDHTKQVTQKEYDEIVAIKPMFIVMDYQ